MNKVKHVSCKKMPTYLQSLGFLSIKQVYKKKKDLIVKNKQNIFLFSKSV